jgi:hypothetical protein
VKKTLVLAALIHFASLHSQVTRTTLYSFLDIPMTARAAGLGGTNMSVWGDDINLVYSNPSLLNASMHHQATLNYCNYVGDLNFAYLGYGHHFGTKGTAAFGLQAFDYGKFNGYDELGQPTGAFRATDYSINVAWARPFADSLFNIGAALKTIFSQYDIYTSVGNALDLGATYRNKKDFVVSLLARNIGYVWKTYNGVEDPRDFPYDWQLGFSKKVEKAPFRIMVVYNQLLRWNLSHVSPIDTTGRTTSLSSETPRDSTSFQKFAVAFGTRADNFMRHVVLGTEIYLSRNLIVRVGYNYRRQREMTLTERRGINAFSFGATLRVKRFGFSYTFAKMAFPGNSNVIGLSFAW